MVNKLHFYLLPLRLVAYPSSSLGDGLYVVVEDDGEGLDPDRFREHEEGLGLTSVRRRIRMAGGTFDVEGARGEGTRVRLGLPYQEAEND
jgi:signal transduction histidine kinase